MPNKNYTPDDYRYYSQPELYPKLSALLNGSYAPQNPLERAFFRLNKDNMRAFLKSQILHTADAPEQIQQLLGNVPGYNPEDPQREARRQLSALAREQMLDLAMDFRWPDEETNLDDRTYLILLSRGQTQDDLNYNERIAKMVRYGTPEERGLLFEKRVRDNMAMFRKCLDGISDREAVENLKALKRCHDVVVNSSNILAMADQENSPIVISDETRQLLNQMNEYSLEVDLVYHRVRAIANPTYEFLPTEGFMDIDSDTYEQMQSDAERNAPGVTDYLMAVDNMRRTAISIRFNDSKAMDDSLEALTQANKGFFIGSRAYSQALQSMEEVTKFLNEMGDSPAEESVEQAKTKLTETIQKCQEYMGKKNPEKFENRREEIRYNAMKRALESCQRNLDYYNAKSNPVENKVEETVSFGKKIPASDVGNIADELRANIADHLTKLKFGQDGFDADYARSIMSNMVVLEMVKNGRSMGDNGQIIAGPVERTLAKRPVETIDAVLNNEYFCYVTKNVTPGSLEQFVNLGIAKTIADNMEKMAEQGSAAVNNEPAAQKDPVVGAPQK